MYDNSLKTGEIPLNAIALFMKWESGSEATAKRALRSTVQSLEDKYCKLKDQFFAEKHEIGTQARFEKIFSAHEAINAGAMLWAIDCPRFKLTTDQNAYLGHLKRRNNEGMQFFGNCMQSADIVPAQVNNSEKAVSACYDGKEAKDHLYELSGGMDPGIFPRAN